MANQRMTQTQLVKALAASCEVNNKAAKGFLDELAKLAVGEAKKNGVRLSATSAISPARGPNSRRVSVNVSQPVAANSATNGSRVAAPSPSASAAKWAIH